MLGGAKGGGDDDDRLPPVVAQTHVRRPERAKADGLRIKGGLTTERGERANLIPPTDTLSAS